MKTLTIGSTTLELNSFHKIRDKVVGVYAQIKIPATAISYEELKALFTDNQYDLVVTEEDGTTTTYSGYMQLDEIREKAGMFTVIQICTSEAIHLLNEARKQIENLEREKNELQGVVNAQGEELQTHAMVITEQNDIIKAQKLNIENLANVVREQSDVIAAQKENVTTLELQNKELNETVNALLGMEE